MAFPNRQFIHVSDLHFGRTDERIIAAFERFIARAQPQFDVVLITGDFTQRATLHQFREAASFLRRLDVPHIVAIPGNHDMPMHLPFLRFLTPLSRYRRYIEPLVKDVFEDDEILVLGLNTQDRWSVKEGRLSNKQISRFEIGYPEVANDPRFKIVLTHHSMFESKILLQKYDERRERVLAMKPHLILSGHNHRFGVFRRAHDPNELFPLEIKAGTGVSVRTREEPNSFNVIELRDDEIHVQVYDYDASAGDFRRTQDRSQVLRGNPASPAPVPEGEAAAFTDSEG